MINLLVLPTPKPCLTVFLPGDRPLSQKLGINAPLFSLCLAILKGPLHDTDGHGWPGTEMGKSLTGICTMYSIYL